MENVIAFEALPWKERSRYQRATTLRIDQGVARKHLLNYKDFRQAELTVRGTIVMGFSTDPATCIIISGQNLESLFKAIGEHRVEAIWISDSASRVKRGSSLPRIYEIVIDRGDWKHISQ